MDVVGAVLTVELLGWKGAPPLIGGNPVRMQARLDQGRQRFVYDLLPQRRALSVSDACLRIGSQVEVALEKWPFYDLPFPARLRLEMGFAAENAAAPLSCDFPAAFLAILSAADVELALSIYLQMTPIQD